MSVSKPTPIRKGTVVRVIDKEAGNYGSTYIVSRIGKTKNSGKDSGLYTVYGDGLTGGRFEQDSKAVAAIGDIGPQDQMAMDQAVVDRRAAQAAERAAAVEAQRQKVKTDADDLAREDAAWQTKEMQVEKGLAYDGVRYEVRTTGPEYEIKKRSGDVITWATTLRVSVDIDRGMTMGAYLLPEEEKPICRTVNWAALGNCSPTLARIYARMILKAADLAEQAEFERAPRRAETQEDA